MIVFASECELCESVEPTLVFDGIEGATHALSTNIAHTEALNLQRLVNDRIRLDISRIQS
ncbi:hypothetical protein [uncultured Helicobacter sp.]|uniref:hypothetical protein n=1 Tax=uncultured Helicobacter sp. TaxID=175537 RepID=UPI00374F74BC